MCRVIVSAICFGGIFYCYWKEAKKAKPDEGALQMLLTVGVIAAASLGYSLEGVLP